MILIISSDSDQSTLEVIKWLNIQGIEWIKLDRNQFLNPTHLSIQQSEENFILETTNGKKIDLSLITGYWYRRNNLSFSIYTDLSSIPDRNLEQNVQRHIGIELQYLKMGMHHLLSEKHGVNDYRYSEVNKLEVLSLARNAGLQIPHTIITTQKSDYLNFLQLHKHVVTKAIQHGARFSIKKDDHQLEYLCYTESIKEQDIPKTFFPTLFQNKLDKDYELRIFFLNNQFYAMAIFSQNDQQTETDFRRYNLDKPNRTVPYELPKSLEKKLCQLMKSIRLNSGSIDIVVTKEGQFVFLEVNPIGQFGMVSHPCNVYLHQIIAAHLSQPYGKN